VAGSGYQIAFQFQFGALVFCFLHMIGQGGREALLRTRANQGFARIVSLANFQIHQIPFARQM